MSHGIVGGVSGFYLLSGNRLDGNSSSGSGGVGFAVAGNSNSLTRNFSAQNSGAAYSVAAGNWVAPINNPAAAGALDNIQQ